MRADSWVLTHLCQEGEKKMVGKMLSDSISTRIALWRTADLGVGNWWPEVDFLISTVRARLRVSLLPPAHEAGKHLGHFEVLFPPLGQCT